MSNTAVDQELQYIRDYYHVPAEVGRRVKYTGSRHGAYRTGTITGTRGQYVMIRLDGDKMALPYHPTWELEYL